MVTTTSEQWVDAETVAIHLGFKQDHVRKMARAGKLYARDMRNGARNIWRFKLSLVDQWMLEDLTEQHIAVQSQPIILHQATA